MARSDAACRNASALQAAFAVTEDEAAMTYYLAEEQLPMRADEQIEQSIPPYDEAKTLGPWASDLWRRASDLVPLAFYIWTLSTGLRPRASGLGPWTSGLGPRTSGKPLND